MEFGGDSSNVKEQLKNVHHIQATYGAFAAILADGSVITWGDPTFAGPPAVQGCLKNQDIYGCLSYRIFWDELVVNIQSGTWQN